MDESEKQPGMEKGEKSKRLHQTTELPKVTKPSEAMKDVTGSNEIGNKRTIPSFEILEDKINSNCFFIKLIPSKRDYKKCTIILKKVTKEEDDQLLEGKELNDPHDYTAKEIHGHKDGLYIIKEITDVNTDTFEKDILIKSTSDIGINPSTNYAIFICGDDRYFSKWDFIKTHDEPEEPSKSNAMWFIMLLSMFVLLIAIAAAFLSSYYREHSYRSIEEFRGKMEKMKLDFPTQEDVLWKILINGGIRHLKKVHDRNSDELAPLSYLVAGYANTRDTMDCFLSRLSKAYTTDAKEQVIDSSKFVNNKGKLDKEIKDSLKGNRKFIIVKDIDRLEFTVAQLFMSYSDEHNTVASYPQSVLILSTELPFPYDPTQSRHSDEAKVASLFRDKVWSGISADFAAPLWSRVGDGLVLLKDEEKNPCSL